MDDNTNLVENCDYVYNSLTEVLSDVDILNKIKIKEPSTVKKFVSKIKNIFK